MGKSATVFKDIGKACNDLLSKDFKVGKSTVEVKSKTKSGVTFTPLATKAGESVSGSLKAEYSFLPWLSCEANCGTNGSMSLSVDAADALTKGLKLTAECDKAANKAGLLQSGNLIAEYKQESMTCKTSYDFFKSALLANASMALGDLTAGLDCAYNAAKGDLTKYSLAMQFVQPDFIVSAKCVDSKGSKTMGCGYYHKVSSLMQVGVDLSKPLSKGDVDIEFGCAYKLDKDTTVKGKVDSAGLLSASFKQKMNAMTTMTLCAQVDVNDLAANKHKFGLALNITP